MVFRSFLCNFANKEIKINKASCPEFTVEIDHVGKLPAAAMHHRYGGFALC